MKAVAYSIKPFEKEYLAKANQKKHDITLISNALDIYTAIYAEGKQVVIVSMEDDVSAKVLENLSLLGIKYIISRSGVNQADQTAAAGQDIKLLTIKCDPSITKTKSTVLLQEIADKTIRILDLCSN